jgi:hypothetical protein
VAHKRLPISQETIEAGTIEAGVRRFVGALRWLASDPQSFPIPIPPYAVRSQEIVNYFWLFYEGFRLIHLDALPDEFKSHIRALADAIAEVPRSSLERRRIWQCRRMEEDQDKRRCAHFATRSVLQMLLVNPARLNCWEQPSPLPILASADYLR